MSKYGGRGRYLSHFGPTLLKFICCVLLVITGLAYADDISKPKDFGGTQGEPYLTDNFGDLYKIHLCMTTDNAGNVIPCFSALGPLATVDQGSANDGSSPWHVIDDAWIADFDAWKVWADVALSTRASESTLSSFQSANHTDLLGVQSRQDTTNTTLTETNLRIGDETETAAATDTSTSGLNGLVKRLLQRVTTLIAFYNSNFGADSGGIRTNAQVGNANGAASFGAGATGAQTLRTASNLYDGSGNAITSQASVSLRPLDVGIAVGGATIDPRHGITRLTQPSPATNGTGQLRAQNAYGMIMEQSEISALALWSRVFFATNNSISSGSTSERAMLLLRNPGGSGINCKINRVALGAPRGGEIIFRFYKNPTVTANGTAVTSIGRTGSSSTCLATTLPTTTSFGSVFWVTSTHNTSADSHQPFDLGYWVEPGEFLLITVQQGVSGQGGGVSVMWGEQ